MRNGLPKRAVPVCCTITALRLAQVTRLLCFCGPNSCDWNWNLQSFGSRPDRLTGLGCFELGAGFFNLRGDVGQSRGFCSSWLGHDAVVEGDAGLAAAEFADVEAVWSFAGDVESLAVALGREEDAILDAGVHGADERRIKRDVRVAGGELTAAGVFNPVFCGLHAERRELAAFDRADGRETSRAGEVSGAVDLTLRTIAVEDGERSRNPGAVSVENDKSAFSARTIVRNDGTDSVVRAGENADGNAIPGGVAGITPHARRQAVAIEQ